MKKLIILLLTVLCLSSCVQESQSKHITTNNNFEIELLFEHDGCKIYRFYDGRWVYYSDCRGQISHDVRHSTGKTHYTTHELTLNN